MRLFAVLALVVAGCVSPPTQPRVLLDATHHTEFERDRIPPLTCPNDLLPVCEPFGRTGPLDCYCVH
jgi:hypothetical protein